MYSFTYFERRKSLHYISKIVAKISRRLETWSDTGCVKKPKQTGFDMSCCANNSMYDRNFDKHLGRNSDLYKNCESKSNIPPLRIEFKINCLTASGNYVE